MPFPMQGSSFIRNRGRKRESPSVSRRSAAAPRGGRCRTRCLVAEHMLHFTQQTLHLKQQTFESQAACIGNTSRCFVQGKIVLRPRDEHGVTAHARARAGVEHARTRTGIGAVWTGLAILHVEVLCRYTSIENVSMPRVVSA